MGLYYDTVQLFGVSYSYEEVKQLENLTQFEEMEGVLDIWETLKLNQLNENETSSDPKISFLEGYDRSSWNIEFFIGLSIEGKTLKFIKSIDEEEIQGLIDKICERLTLPKREAEIICKTVGR